ncbi:hypothetical protein [Ornithinibacillus sp. 179-J 7C1 HS]|uniref:hypothetical protein n=1 Tax=Ornithinibacillus sp. 179-J 7C1 HS TaxID=3142384 RepID=UPI0039A3ED84
MIKIRLKTEKSFRITIPVPYFVLHCTTSIICSNLVWKQITQNTDTLPNIYPPMQKQLIKPLLKKSIKEMQHYRGITIVDVKEGKGSQITIKL